MLEMTPELYQKMMRRCSATADGCIEYTGTLDSDGYCRISVSKNRKVKGHRLAYAHVMGPLIEGLVIDHVCCNRRCVNPFHLRQVTQAENTWSGNRTKHRSEGGSFLCAHCGSREFRMSRMVAAHGGYNRTCVPCGKEARRKSYWENVEYERARKRKEVSR